MEKTNSFTESGSVIASVSAASLIWTWKQLKTARTKTTNSNHNLTFIDYLSNLT